MGVLTMWMQSRAYRRVRLDGTSRLDFTKDIYLLQVKQGERNLIKDVSLSQTVHLHVCLREEHAYSSDSSYALRTESSEILALKIASSMRIDGPPIGVANSGTKSSTIAGPLER